METRDRNAISYNNNPPQEASSRLTSDTKRNGTQDQRLHQLHPNPQPEPEPEPDPSGVLPATARAVVVCYRECLKNHAANLGRHVLDGCGEFMPSGAHDTPEALRCAACECHRSFHRRDVQGKSIELVSYTTHRLASPTPLTNTPPPQPPPQSPQQRHHQPMPSMMMAFGGTPDESSSEDLNIFRTNAQTSKKRFRTKFTEEQKEKMHDLAESIGWKIQKQNEQEVIRVCSHVGLKREVFKVWMHNNKQASKKKQL